MIETSARFAAVPAHLKTLPQWVVWKYEVHDNKRTKVPYSPKSERKASTINPDTWGTFEDACAAVDWNERFAGIGFVFKAGGGIVGFDADHQRDPRTGAISDEARAWLDRFATYTEISPSKTGVHALAYGALPGPGKKQAPFEVYDAGRFFTVTGERIDEYPADLAHVNGALTDLYESMAVKEVPSAPRLTPATDQPTIDDDEVIRLATLASNGAKFRALWAGDTSAEQGDASSADMALCNHLAYWCRRDAAQMDRLFRRSGLMRPKWDERRGTSTYGANTIDEAIRVVASVYEPAAPLRWVDEETGELFDEAREEDEESDEKKKKNKRDLSHAAQLWAALYRETWSFDLRARVWRHWVGTHHQEEDQPSIALDQQAIHVLKSVHIAITSAGRIDSCIRTASSYCAREFEPSPSLVNFTNGTLDTATGELHEHVNADDLLYCLPFEYHRAPYPAILAFLDVTIPDAEGRAAYMTHIGLGLLGDTRLHKSLLLLGPPRSGKSTCLALANAACGHAPQSNAGPSLFSPESEGLRSRAMWNSRRMVTLEELPVEALRQEEIVKAMMAHGGVQMRHPYQRELLQNQWRPKLMMATNEKPRYSDRTGALTKRLVPIACPHGRGEQAINAFLIESLLVELPGFAADCLEHALQVLHADHGRYPMSAQMRALLADIEQHGDALKTWQRDHITFDEDAWTPTDVLYASYKAYCEENGNKIMAKERFSSSIVERYPQAVLRARRVESGLKARGIAGVRFRTYADEPTEDVDDTVDTKESAVNAVQF